MKILFVCLGNICRSPTAEGVFRTLLERRGLADRYAVDSAGTGSWHTGAPPDPRMRSAASGLGFTLTGAARQVHRGDFDAFDLILAMDGDNLASLEAKHYDGARAKLRLFRDFDPLEPGSDVPDPYYGGEEGFIEVVRIVERTSGALLDALEEARRE